MSRPPLPAPLHAVALTRAGARLAGRLAEALPGTSARAPARFAADVPGVIGFEGPVADQVRALWPGAGGFLLVMAAGVAVRSIAPLLSDKTRDPAVVVLDPDGRFAVPVLSGHLGGANDLARAVAARLGATAVITTATDAAGRPAAEVWARHRGWRWEPRAGVVRINAAWADGEPVAAYADPAAGGAGLVDGLGPDLARVFADEAEAAGWAGPLLAVSHRRVAGLRADLWVRPRCLVLGVGCRRDADPEGVIAGVTAALDAAGLAAAAAAAVATVEIKAREPAILELAEALGAPLETFPPDALAGTAVPTPSRRVERAVGTPSVAEAAAVLASRGGRLVLPKVKGADWTLAVALRPP